MLDERNSRPKTHPVSNKKQNPESHNVCEKEHYGIIKNEPTIPQKLISSIQHVARGFGQIRIVQVTVAIDSKTLA